MFVSTKFQTTQMARPPGATKTYKIFSGTVGSKNKRLLKIFKCFVIEGQTGGNELYQFQNSHHFHRPLILLFLRAGDAMKRVETLSCLTQTIKHSVSILHELGVAVDFFLVSFKTIKTRIPQHFCGTFRYASICGLRGCKSEQIKFCFAVTGASKST